MAQIASSAADLSPPAAIIERVDASVMMPPDGADGHSLSVAGQSSSGAKAADGDRSARVAGLDRIVADVVRQVIDRPAGDVPDAAARSDRPNGDGNPSDPADVAHAVIVAHEARIEALRTRIDALRAAGGAKLTLADLDTRLRRAEAARRLAIARTGGAPGQAVMVSFGPAVRGAGAHLARYRSAPSGISVAATSMYKDTPRDKGRAAVRTVVHSRLVIGGNRVDRPVVLVVAALSHPSSVARRATVHAAIGGRATRRADVRRSMASRLASARRSLAHARSLLTDWRAQTSRPAAPQATMIAGLWRWEGSETWTLASVRAG